MQSTPTRASHTVPRAILGLLAASCLSSAQAVAAGIRVAAIFSDHMVLQRETSVPVWGWAEPGASVTVRFDGQTATATADANGKWMAKLAPMDANRTGQTLTVETAGGEPKAFFDVVVGEVWLAAGQSNMVAGGPDKPTGVYPFHRSPDTATAPMRFRNFGFGTDPEPVEDFPPVYRDNADHGWKELTVGTSANIPQYFVRVVRDGLNVPVGMVCVAYPGTNQGAWMSKEAMERFGSKDGNFYLDMRAQLDSQLSRSPKTTSDGATIATFDQFREYQEKWVAAPKGKGRYPGGGLREMDFVNWPTVLYNTRIHPLAPFAMRGVIWHQGEAGPGQDYDQHLIAMFAQWRQLFGQDLYCLWGTLARSTAECPPLEPGRSRFYRSLTNVSIRKAESLADDKMRMVEFYDLGYCYTHWLQKAESGRRMGLAALDLAYGQQHAWSGPRMRDVTREGGAVRITFEQVGERLDYAPNLDGISGVLLVSPDRQARWGHVEVLGKDTIKVSHPEIAEVAEISYAISPNPWETLFGSAGLPASPFQRSFEATGDYASPKPTRFVVELLDKGVADLNLGHVRRDGYSFDLQSKNPVQVRVRAYIPAEWPGFAIQHQGTPVPSETSEIDGRRYATFTAASDGTPYAVTSPDSAAKFAPIHRF